MGAAITPHAFGWLVGPEHIRLRGETLHTQGFRHVSRADAGGRWGWLWTGDVQAGLLAGSAVCVPCGAG
ncbi:hypothetical protein AD951_12735 [Acetobacter malorum]|uniref:Uncharacterized protein n=1 Tax=Acetobacter malorum TaxID=178901 RepID=A0A149VCJ7_9PROT|nr:hypothetical protein AD951_12735 [Acetobacter malorum]KXV77969.1 hypothetical protein AD953_04365 [Acetobacter malorum]